MIPQHSLPGGRYPLPVPPAGSRQLRLAHANSFSAYRPISQAQPQPVRFVGKRRLPRVSRQSLRAAEAGGGLAVAFLGSTPAGAEPKIGCQSYLAVLLRRFRRQGQRPRYTWFVVAGAAQ